MKIHSSDFEAVDESSLMIQPDSGAVTPANLAAVVNAASYAAGAVAAGEIVALFGERLGPEIPAVYPWFNPPPLLENGGTQVLFDSTPAAMLYAQSGQVTAVVPATVAGKAFTDVKVTSVFGSSNVLTLPVAAAAPGIFAVLNQDGSYNTPSNPAESGSNLMLYATGIDPSLATSSNAGVVTAVQVVEGVPGLFQIVLQLTAGPGTLPLVLTVGDARAQDGLSVTIR